MTLAGYRHRILVIDRSGSIRSILEGQQQGLMEFLATEGTIPGKATYSLWDFDTEILRHHVLEPSADKLLAYRIEPRGGTALYDAVFTAVTDEGNDLAALPEDERPEDVVLIVSSDGAENSSSLHSGAAVKELLTQQQDVYKWRVLYMGFGKAAFDEGERVGTRHGLTVNSVSSNIGSRNAWKMSSDYVTRTPYAAAAAGQGISLDFSDEERSLGESGEEQPVTGEKDENAGS